MCSPIKVFFKNLPVCFNVGTIGTSVHTTQLKSGSKSTFHVWPLTSDLLTLSEPRSINMKIRRSDEEILQYTPLPAGGARDEVPPQTARFTTNNNMLFSFLWFDFQLYQKENVVESFLCVFRLWAIRSCVPRWFWAQETPDSTGFQELRFHDSVSTAAVSTEQCVAHGVNVVKCHSEKTSFAFPGKRLLAVKAGCSIFSPPQSVKTFSWYWEVLRSAVRICFLNVLM